MPFGRRKTTPGGKSAKGNYSRPNDDVKASGKKKNKKTPKKGSKNSIKKKKKELVGESPAEQEDFWMSSPTKTDHPEHVQSIAEDPDYHPFEGSEPDSDWHGWEDNHNRSVAREQERLELEKSFTLQEETVSKKRKHAKMTPKKKKKYDMSLKGGTPTKNDHHHKHHHSKNHAHQAKPGEKLCDFCNKKTPDYFCKDEGLVFCARCSAKRHKGDKEDHLLVHVSHVNLSDPESEVPCDHCKKQPASHWCVDEGLGFCRKCNKTHHAEEENEDHKRVYIEDADQYIAEAKSSYTYSSYSTRGGGSSSDGVLKLEDTSTGGSASTQSSHTSSNSASGTTTTTSDA